MTPVRICVLLAAATASVVFIAALRLCFRTDGRAYREKRWMVASIYAWTVLEWWALLRLPAPAPRWQWAGVALFCAAILLFVWSIGTLRKSRPSLAFVDGPSASIVAAGPYALVRHPIYVSYLLAWIAGALATGQVWLLLAVVWMGWFYVRAAGLEERQFLAGPLGNEFAAYRRRAGMFVPRIRAARP